MFNRTAPIFHLGKIPIHAAGLIVLIEIIGMLIVVITATKVLPFVSFSVNSFFGGEVWRIFTYALFSHLDLMALVGLYFFYKFGGMVEGALGRKLFLILCGTILMVPPLILIAGNVLGASSSTSILLGSHIMHMAIFCVFCVMHPNLPMMLIQVPLKWIGLLFFVVTVLSYVQTGAYTLAVATICAVALACWMIQARGLALIKIFPDSMMRSKPKKKLVKKSKARKARKPTPKPKIKPKANVAPETEIDTILDKISDQGLHSLTPEERKTLESISKK